MGGSLPTVGIIGGGASGALTAIHILAQTSTEPIHLVLVERGGAIGEGVAFSTDSYRHLLNVQAHYMSALEADPDHFVRWLEGNASDCGRDSFAPRRLYGRFLTETLHRQVNLQGRQDVFQTIRDQVVDIDVGPGPQLVLAGGGKVGADAVVLATGLVAPKVPQYMTRVAAGPRFISDPWAGAALSGIDSDATVTLIGSGLTAIDVLLSLEELGHRGPIHAVSRHGLVPHAHRPLVEQDTEVTVCAHGNGASARRLLHEVRGLVAETESRGGDWRQIVDGLRPLTATLWRSLSEEERRRFRRHLERYWSVHRHRMAPEVANTVDRLTRSGLFRIHAGRLVTVDEISSPPAYRIGVRLRANGALESWLSGWVINCSGPDPNVFTDPRNLLSRLGDRRLARPGPLGLGVATDVDGRLLGCSGRPVEWLWTLGSLRQGDQLESTAVPEIRQQACAIATEVRRFVSRCRRVQQGGKEGMPTVRRGEAGP